MAKKVLIIAAAALTLSACQTTSGFIEQTQADLNRGYKVHRSVQAYECGSYSTWWNGYSYQQVYNSKTCYKTIETPVALDRELEEKKLENARQAQERIDRCVATKQSYLGLKKAKKDCEKLYGIYK